MKKPQLLILLLLGAGVLTLICGVFMFCAYLYFESAYSTPQMILPNPPGVACTMEAKLCPDGSYYGRSEASTNILYSRS